MTGRDACPHEPALEEIERGIRHDAGLRGLLGIENADWRRGDLSRAVRSLCAGSGVVAVVTGFAIPLPQGAVAETDGPLGSVLLADVLQRLGHKVVLVTDEICRGAIEVAAAASMTDYCVEAMPLSEQDAEMIRLLGDDAALAMLAELPRDQRDAVAAHVVDDRGYPELAEALGTSEAAVRQRVSRGLATLRRRRGGRA